MEVITRGSCIRTLWGLSEAVITELSVRVMAALTPQTNMLLKPTWEQTSQQELWENTPVNRRAIVEFFPHNMKLFPGSCY